jgi:hypothetical protein
MEARSPHLRGSLAPALALAVAAMAIACLNWWLASRARMMGLDADSWGVLVERLSQDNRLAVLFHDPPTWKGPIVPFVFGLAYWLVPTPVAPLGLNVILVGLVALVSWFGLVRLGFSRWAVSLGVLGWVAFPPHRYIFAYYYAEPWITLLLCCLAVAAGLAIATRRQAWTLTAGVLAGGLLLSRPPYLLVVGLFALLIWIRNSRRQALAYALALFVVWAPWPIRNALRFGHFIPFTEEGGDVLFQGFYVPLDDGVTETVASHPVYRAYQAEAAKMSPADAYAFWQRRAWDAIWSDPLGQIKLSFRKAQRFWVYLPDYATWPSWKTTLAAAIYLPLAAVAIVRGRRQTAIQVAAIPILGLWAMHIVVHSEMRYNDPILLFTFALAVTGATWLISGTTPLRPETSTPRATPAGS